jgi:DNA-binding NarL/FixJ family response regulator
MDGIKTLEALKKSYLDIKTIILSMHEDEQFVLHLIESGANGYLLKNATVAKVIEAINSVTETDFYFDEFINTTMRKGLVNKKRVKVILDDQFDLSEREIEILDLICKQFTTSEIGEKLFLSARTIEGYRKNLLLKMGVRNTAGLIVYCTKKGIIQLDNY